ncbi:hypothetical protein CCH79_00015107 [Gambusia affinis]|uniref:Uncharacterized protein n=1 Tax=Gambusia affinis TaxID=33528 RepID=A0A315W8V4_GAMAF|nr:hypothetical protein CCH79_00015107 [Gambusia affinis]
MGDSSLKKIFLRKKKKKSPFSSAFKELQRALPKTMKKKKKKSKKKSLLKQLHLESLKKDKKSKKKFAWLPPTRDKKAPKSTKILSLGKERKESNTSEGPKEKDREGLARVGDKIKKTFSPENKKEVSAEPEVTPLKETHEGKISLQKLKDIVKPRRQSETNAK